MIYTLPFQTACAHTPAPIYATVLIFLPAYLPLPDSDKCRRRFSFIAIKKPAASHNRLFYCEKCSKM